MPCGFQVIDPSSGSAGLIADIDDVEVSTIAGGSWTQKVRLTVLGLAALIVTGKHSQ